MPLISCEDDPGYGQIRITSRSTKGRIGRFFHQIRGRSATPAQPRGRAGDNTFIFQRLIRHIHLITDHIRHPIEVRPGSRTTMEPRSRRVNGGPKPAVESSLYSWERLLFFTNSLESLKSTPVLNRLNCLLESLNAAKISFICSFIPLFLHLQCEPR